MAKFSQADLPIDIKFAVVELANVMSEHPDIFKSFGAVHTIKIRFPLGAERVSIQMMIEPATGDFAGPMTVVDAERLP